MIKVESDVGGGGLNLNSATGRVRWDVRPYLERLASVDDLPRRGHVAQLIGLTIEATGPSAQVGELCTIYPREGGEPLPAEVVGFREQRTLLMPLGEMDGIAPGSLVVSSRRGLTVPVGPELLGRVIDALGRPIDGKGSLRCTHTAEVRRRPPDAMERARISLPLGVGVKAVDALLTCGRGQRLGIFAGSGVGKSTLLGTMARFTEADVNCIALIGERGREVREFIERDLGPEGLRRSVVVVATSDQPALMRLKGAYVATAVAEWFRDQGMDVLLMMDSVTRFAAAQREIGLAVGEPPATKGYPPSVFAILPKLLERAGTAAVGTITGLYTVLVDGDDLMDPVADAARSILDGHIVLSRALAERQHYPAIDVLASVSRVMPEVVSPEHRHAAARLKRLLAAYASVEDLIHVGAYVSGRNPEVDEAIERREEFLRFLRQDVGDGWGFDATREALLRLVGGEGA